MGAISFDRAAELAADHASGFRHSVGCASCVHRERRERIATMLFASLLNHTYGFEDDSGNAALNAKKALVWADALIAELDK